MELCVKLSCALLLLSASLLQAGTASLVLVDNGHSRYKIVIPEGHTAVEMEAATVLQYYLRKVTGTELPIVKDSHPKSVHEVLIGNTNRLPAAVFKHPDELLLRVSRNTLILNGGKSKGILYAAYTFTERFLGCRKFAADFTYIPTMSSVKLSADLMVTERPDFEYREVYYPDSKDQSYLDWHRLIRLDDVWGLWVHTFDKLVPANQHFNEHPEYYALVDGQRNASQLCLSDPEVLRILSQNLKSRMEDDPAMKYWSVSQNDGMGFCQCHQCSTVDEKEGGPQGSIIRFVNKVAEQFPDKIISTLAYTYSEKAPLITRPLKNVQVMLSTIECNRSRPIATDPRSIKFRKNLKDWSLITKNLFIWDYNVQFTNYVSPFPNFSVLQSNMKFFKSNNVKGIFSQGTGETSGEFSALRGYLLAKLSWNTKANVQELSDDFLAGYYGNAAPFIQEYIDLLEAELKASGRQLDIYGNPVNQHTTYLRPSLLEQYGKLFDEAELAVQQEPILLAHVRAARLPLEFAVLQQSRFYGIEQYGAFVQNEDGKWAVKPSIKSKLELFVQNAKTYGIKSLSENGYSPDQYAREWEQIFEAGPKDHLAIHAVVNAVVPFSDEYPNKGIRTLTDGTRGYLDHQYNWLGWHGTDMEVILDLGTEKQISQVSTGFLEDQRHWAFLPLSVSYSFSVDGEKFTDVVVDEGGALYENYDKSVKEYKVELPSNFKTRYIRVHARNTAVLPKWRFYIGKKAWLFADEIMVR